MWRRSKRVLGSKSLSFVQRRALAQVVVQGHLITRTCVHAHTYTDTHRVLSALHNRINSSVKNKNTNIQTTTKNC